MKTRFISMFLNRNVALAAIRYIQIAVQVEVRLSLQVVETAAGLHEVIDARQQVQVHYILVLVQRV